MNSNSLIICLVFWFIGLPTLGFGVWQLWREVAPRRWRQAPGTVVSSTIDRRYIANGGYQYIPKVEYEYQVNEQRFRSSRLCPVNYVTGGKEEAKEIRARYPVDSQVTVYFNPRNPGRSVLEFGAMGLSWICIGLGLLASMVGTLPLMAW